jgi:Flp pilus assembly protein TadG
MSNQLDGSPVDNGRLCAGDHTGTGIPRSFSVRLRRFVRCNRGVAAVEFGLAAPVLLAVLIPVADLGMAFSQEQQLRQAVQAGAQYAASRPWDQNAPSAIAGTVISATPLSGISVSPAPYRICGCPTQSGGSGGSSGNTKPGSESIITATCGSTCAEGQIAGYYAIVSAQLPYTPILPYSLLGSSTTLSAKSMIRVP